MRSAPSFDLSALVSTPGAHSIGYLDTAFPNRLLWLHGACPRNYDTTTPVLLVHHGVGRNGRDYRDYWLRVVDDIGVLVIAIEFTEDSFPNYLWYHFGNLHDENGAPNPREQWTYGIDDRLFQASRSRCYAAQHLRSVRPLRRRAVCPSHAVVWLS